MKSVKYSNTYRIIHWAIAISFLLLLITIFLRLTWMNRDNMAAIIQSYLSSNTDLTLSQEQLIALAKRIRAPMWDWHVYIGYALVGLFGLRFAVPFFGQMKIQNPFSPALSIKEKFQKWSYILFYALVIVSLTTGLIIELGPKAFKKSMEDIHVLSIYYLVPFIIIHLTGVLWAEFTDQKGIVSRIVSGEGAEGKEK